MAQRVANGVKGIYSFSNPKHTFKKKEHLFKKTLQISGAFILILLFAILATLIVDSYPSIKAFGVEFLYGSTWNPVSGKFAAFPFFVGTILTSFLSLAISVPFSLAISIFLGEYFKRGTVPLFIQSAIELLAGVPSVIYGLWAMFFLVPIVRKFEMQLGVVPYGVGIFTASVILSIMIIPFSASIGREVLKMVPEDIIEAAYSLGATRYEVIKKVILPYSISGIVAGFLLSLGRAIGETMAVTMVIGNSPYLPKDIFSPSNTMASVIANEFTEASGNLYLSALIEIGLFLFLVTTVINIVGRWIVNRLDRQI